MRKLNFILLYIWSSLAFAVATKAQVNKPYGEWFKLGVRVVQQQPVSFDLSHLLFTPDAGSQWLHAAAIMTA